MGELSPSLPLALVQGLAEDGQPLPPPTACRDVLRLGAGGMQAATDEVIEEVPVALVYNGISQAVMLASPTDLEDFALGFSLTEGILDTPAELYGLEVVQGCDGITIEMEIASRRFLQLKDKRRQLAGRTGCGLCGVDSLAQVAERPVRVAQERPLLAASAIRQALQQLPDCQPLRQHCGSAHAAAWADAAGNIRLVREDVGRHNALDKLLGGLLRSGEPLAGGFVLVTSRASYEMVQKVASLGLSTLIAVSAPTALAVRQADTSGLLLVGFARERGLVVYSGADRLLDDGAFHVPDAG